MVLKNFWVILFFCGLPLTLPGQRMNYQTDWNPGVVVLNDNTIVKGQVKYIQKKENVVVKKQDKKTTYHASDIKYFQFFDKELGFNRAFSSLNRTPHQPYGEIQIFEIVLEGAFPYYRKPILVEKIVVKHDKATSNHIIDDFVEYIYFLKTDENLVEVKKFGNDVLPLLKKHIKEISRFIRENKLDYTLASDQIQIIDRYNALEEEMALKKGSVN